MAQVDDFRKVIAIYDAMEEKPSYDFIEAGHDQIWLTCFPAPSDTPEATRLALIEAGVYADNDTDVWTLHA